MLISGVKFACGTCIKGHRASTCKHTDRPLFEIRRKGRPVSQCLLCRDLRKTKQLHIKCICNKKKKGKSSKCVCWDNEGKAHTSYHLETVSFKHSNSDSPEPRAQPTKDTSALLVKQPSPIAIPSSTGSNSCDSDGICSSKKGPSSPSYCWALVSPENQCHLHTPFPNVGYVFQKSNLEKQVTNSDLSKKTLTPPSSLFLPTPSPSTFLQALSPSSVLDHKYPSTSPSPSSSSITTTPLSRSVSSSSATNLDDDIMKELDDELCNLLNNMIYHQHHDDISSLSPSTSPPVTYPTHPMSSSSSSSSSTTINSKVPPHPLYSHCRKLAQWHPQPPPPGQVGESVIITMTPLPKWTGETVNQPQQQTTSTTKIVTCYCGPSCTCPGCLVHPTRSIFASQGLDPYAGYPTARPYSFSSDED